MMRMIEVDGMRFGHGISIWCYLSVKDLRCSRFKYSNVF